MNRDASMKNIKHLQEVLMNSWPAHHYYFFKGWILRFTSGITDRANSVFPINYTGNQDTINEDLDYVEKAYKAFNLPTIFTIPENHEPYNLDIKLRARGYQQMGFSTNTMIIPIENINNHYKNEEFSYTSYPNRVEEFASFLAKYSKRDVNAQRELVQLSNRIIIPLKSFIVAKYEGSVIGTLMGVLDHYHYLYIADVFIKPNFRHRNIASSLFYEVVKKLGIPNKAQLIWLQVESDNESAMNLYTKLRMKKLYSYYYLKKLDS